MVLPTSGSTIKFSDIRNEFGGTSNNNIGSYRISETYGDKNYTLDTGIPSSGTIRWSDFNDKRLNLVVDCYADCADNRVVARDEYDNNNVSIVGSGTLNSPAKTKPTNTSGNKVDIRVNKTIGSVRNGYQAYCALRTGDWETNTALWVDVGSQGKICGAGGNGGAGGDGTGDGGDSGYSGGDATSALGLAQDGVQVKIESGGALIGGFGGGGGGAGIPGGLGGIRGEGEEGESKHGIAGEEPFLGQEDGGAGGGPTDTTGDDPGCHETGYGGRGGDFTDPPQPGGTDCGSSAPNGAAGGNGFGVIFAESDYSLTWRDTTSSDKLYNGAAHVADGVLP